MADVIPADASDEMYVTKRDGNQEIVSFDKILKRIKNLGQEANMNPSPTGADSYHHRFKINYTALVMKVIDQLYDGISTTKIDELSAEQCASMASIHTDYNALAGRISISNHHKNTTPSFVNAMTELYSFLDKQGNHSPLVSQELYEIVCKYPTELEDMIVHDRDYLIDYFGFKTLDRAYLTRINKKTVERPQYMWLRVAIGIHGDNLEKIRETYDYMSQKCFTHATPTLFNAGTPRPQLSSCFEKNTPVNTLRGPIPIKDVKIGDEVITHLGNVKKVVQCHENKIGDRKLYSVFIHKTPEFIVTEDHKLFVYDKKTKTTNWKEVRHLSNSDYIMIPNYNGSIAKSEINVLDVILKHDLSKNDNKMTIELNDDKTRISLRTHWEHCNLNKGQQLCVSKNSTSIYNIISIDNVFMKFLGIWFGDGHIIVYNSKKNNNHRIRGIGFKIHKDNEKLVDFCIGMKDRFGIENVTVHKMKTQNVIQVLYNCPALGILFQELYGKGFAGKKLPDDFYKYDTNLITSFLSGLITTDGCVSASGAITLCMANKKLMFDLYSLCRIHNLDVSKPNPVKRQKLTKTQAYCMTLTNLRNDLVDIWKTYTDDRVVKTAKKPYIDAKRICADGFKYLRFQKRVEVEIDDEHVYTLGVEDDHSYSINGIIAQNCFLLSMEEDSIEGIFNTLKDCALISKLAGGIGLHIHNVRAKGSHIRGTNGSSNGIVPMLRVFNNTAKYVDQGGGKRNGSFAIYLEPWHADIESFLQMRKNHGDEELKARDLFYALWIPDLFMERIKADANWTLMCPNECPGLADVYGQDFVELYTKYEAEGRGRATVKARQLWFQVLDAQMETGTPYLLYKDACNKKSNQKNIGTIKSSNLCCEIVQVSNEEESAVCNLASIALPAFISSTNNSFDFEKLHKVSRIVTYNLNRVIDINYYPTEKTKRSNLRHRPIGIGVQGLADVFMILGFPFASDEARRLNKQIFETIYHAALEESCDLARRDGAYETFVGSPASQGILQYDMWNVEPEPDRYDWTTLKTEIQTHGLRNSLLLAPMPTASTSQILGYNECIEPITSNIYNRRTLAGEFILANKYLMQDLVKLDLWNEKIKNNIIANHGSVQHIESIPKEIREKYKTVWEIPMRALIDMAADRGAYVCQSQSLNLWLEDPTYSNLTSMHFYSWSKGLKTGIYYLRRRARHQAQQFTIEPEKKKGESASEEVCEMCSA